jgi:hypothetical protein
VIARREFTPLPVKASVQAVQALILGKNPTTAMLAAMQKVDITT